jgi:hypothetical protein
VQLLMLALRNTQKMEQLCTTAKTEVSFDTGIHNSQAPFKARQLQRINNITSAYYNIARNDGYFAHLHI